tara:strand:- start:1190 stop:1744 length:555 start_codon:yes stop_codon:yes gene_type:complete
MTNEKTHWLSNQNKNYLGHFDLPNGDEIVLTIKTANWEEVVDPRTKRKENKRVIRFSDNFPWLKPLICNETNAKMVYKVTGEKYMEDCAGKKLKIGVDKTKMKGEEVDCIRIKNVKQDVLVSDTINDKQRKEIEELLTLAKKDKKEFCDSLKLNALTEIKSVKFTGYKNRLQQIINASNETKNN